MSLSRSPKIDPAAVYARHFTGFRLRMEIDARLQNPGRVYASPPSVWAVFYGAAGIPRAVFAYTLLKTPGFGFTDRTGRLRSSIRRVYPGNIVIMGDASAYYALYVERWGRPMRRAFMSAVAAIDTTGAVR